MLVDLSIHPKAQEFYQSFQEEHFYEAGSLWLIRNTVVNQPHYSMRDLTKLDRRLEAHLYALRCSRADIWTLCRKSMERRRPEDLFASSVLAFEGNDQSRVDCALGYATLDGLFHALMSGTIWLSDSRFSERISFFKSQTVPAIRRLGLAAQVELRNPLSCLEIAEAADDPDPLLRACAMRAIGELGMLGMDAELRHGITDLEESCRFWAVWSSALLYGDENSLVLLRAFAERTDVFGQYALPVVVSRMNVAVVRCWQNNMTCTKESLRTSLLVAGALGDPAAIDFIISQMSDTETARVAGEAFTTITGTDLTQEHLHAAESDNLQRVPADVRANENSDLDPDEYLAWPDSRKVSDWWQMNRDKFSPGKRYLLGKCIEEEWLEDVLRNGRQRQRATAALELSMRRQGHAVFNVRAPIRRQELLLRR